MRFFFFGIQHKIFVHFLKEYDPFSLFLSFILSALHLSSASFFVSFPLVLVWLIHYFLSHYVICSIQTYFSSLSRLPSLPLYCYLSSFPFLVCTVYIGLKTYKLVVRWLILKYVLKNYLGYRKTIRVQKIIFLNHLKRCWFQRFIILTYL